MPEYKNKQPERKKHFSITAGDEKAFTVKTRESG